MVRGVAAPLRRLSEGAGFDEVAPWRLQESPTRLLRMARLAAAARGDLGLAIRRTRARPIATGASVVTLGVAIGAAASTWSLISAVLLDPLPVRDPGRLVVVGSQPAVGPNTTFLQEGQLYPFYLSVRASEAFDGIAAGGLRTQTVELDGQLARRSYFFASHDYFDTLGVRMALGREFTSDEDRRGAPLVVVLSHRLWRSAFNADPAILGRVVSVGRQPATVIGVAPRAFRGVTLNEAPDLYMPLHAAGHFGDGRVNWFAEPDTDFSPTAWIRVVGRLRDRDSTSRLAEHLSVAAGRRVVLTDVRTASLPAASRPDMAKFLDLLGGAVGLLLLAGALSVANLLMVRAEARRDEFAVCLALGASRSRLAAGAALDGIILALAGAVLALPLAVAFYASVRAFDLPGGVSLDLLDRSLDAQVLAASIAAALVAASLIAAIAAMFSFTTQTGDALRARNGSTPRLRRRWSRTALVVIQTAVAVVLAAGAGLFGRSLTQALSLNPKYDTTRIITGSVNTGPAGYDANRAATLFGDLRIALLQRPSIRNVAFARFGSGMSAGGSLRIDGVRRAMPSMTQFRIVDERYFATTGLGLLRGRDFGFEDRAGSPLVGIVSESLGRFVAPDDPLGHVVAEPFTAGPGMPPREIRIIGVVPDVIENVSRLEPLVIYQPLAQRGDPLGPISRDLVIRATGRADLAMDAARDALASLDSSLTIDRLQTIDQSLLRQLAPQHFGMLVLSALGALAILLTILGTAVLAESMAVLRRREMGIRAAIGATGRQLAGLVLLETMKLVGAGVIIGVLISWLAAGTIEALLFQVKPLDPTTLGWVTSSILVLALTVSVRPALRVARVDLASVLREE